MVKRSIPFSFQIQNPSVAKKIKISEHDPKPITSNMLSSSIAVLMDEDLLFEVLKHVDARTLGAAACVSRRWNTTARDERLWELICSRHWTNIGCGSDQLRVVVLALGGFRCLYSHYLLRLLKPSVSKSVSSSSSTVAAATASSAWPCLPIQPRTVNSTKPGLKTRWGKDEIQLSLSLLSVRYFEKLNYNNRSR